MSEVIDLHGRQKTARTTENGKVPPVRRKNADIRSREYLRFALCVDCSETILIRPMFS